jgi:hypothetical protein
MNRRSLAIFLGTLLGAGGSTPRGASAESPGKRFSTRKRAECFSRPRHRAPPERAFSTEVVPDRRIRPLSRQLAACQGGVNATGNTVEFRY